MTAVHRRAAARELQVAKVLGSKRVHRGRYERAPDVVPIRFANGTVIVPESKTREKLPKWLIDALGQARKYVKGSVPCVVLSEFGGEPLAVMPLADLAMLVGLRSPKDGEQLLLLGGRVI